MRIFRKNILLFALLLIIGAGAAVAAQETYIYDDGRLLDGTQAAKLQEHAMRIQEEWELNILLFTTDDAHGKTARELADDFYDECFPESSEEDGICYLIDMDHREIYVSTSGIAIRYLTDERIDRILDAAYEEAADGNYYETFVTFLEETEKYLSMGIPKDQYNYDTETGERDYYADSYAEHKQITKGEFLFALIAALAAAGIIVGVIVGRYQLRFEDFHYNAYTDSEVHLTLNSDRLTNTFVTHRRIPRNDGNSGGGGSGSSVHTSSSGRSHGGGGRSF